MKRKMISGLLAAAMTMGLFGGAFAAEAEEAGYSGKDHHLRNRPAAVLKGVHGRMGRAPSGYRSRCYV